MPTISLVGSNGFSNDVCPIRPLVKGVIGNDGGAFRHHQHETRIEDRFAIERTELTAGGGATDAKGVLATDEEWNFLLEPLPIGRKEPDQASEVIVMAVA